jgi:hypothetical protein
MLELERLRSAPFPSVSGRAGLDISHGAQVAIKVTDLNDAAPK